MIFAGSNPARGTTLKELTMKIYGPYIRKDQRKHIIIVHDSGKKQTKSYPRYLMEQFLGRELLPEETVDHINNDKTDDRIENLQILSLADNARKQMALTPRQFYEFVCPNCKKIAKKYYNYVLGNWKKGKSGPFCSRKCGGQATYVNPWTHKDV